MPQVPVSVVIPVYNREAYVGQTIQSVLRQTFSDFELVVINDGSTDRSESVIRGFKDSRLTVVTQSNQGLARTWNIGLGRARGEFVKLLDSDDLIAPTFLGEHLEFARRIPESDVVYSNWVTIDEHGAFVSKTRLGEIPSLWTTLLHGNVFGVHEMLFRKVALDSVGAFDSTIRICEDWDLYLRMARRGCRFRHLDRVLSFHRVHSGTYKKAVTDRFRQVIEKTFSDESLEAEHRSLRPLCEARHALFLMEDCLRWGWPEEADRCLERFIEALERLRTHPQKRKWYTRWLVPIWPRTAGGWIYVRHIRERLIRLGTDVDLVHVLDRGVARSFLARPVRRVRQWVNSIGVSHEV